MHFINVSEFKSFELHVTSLLQIVEMRQLTLMKTLKTDSEEKRSKI